MLANKTLNPKLLHALKPFRLALLPLALLGMGLLVCSAPTTLWAQYTLQFGDQPINPGDSIVYRPITPPHTTPSLLGDNVIWDYDLLFATGEADSLVYWLPHDNTPGFDTANLRIVRTHTELGLTSEERLYLRQDSLGLFQVGLTRSATADSFFDNAVYISAQRLTDSSQLSWAEYPLQNLVGWRDTQYLELALRLTAPFFNQQDSSATLKRSILRQDSIRGVGVLDVHDTFYIGNLTRTVWTVTDSLFQDGQLADPLLLDALGFPPLPQTHQRLRYSWRSGNAGWPVLVFEGEILPNGDELITHAWADANAIRVFDPPPSTREETLQNPDWSFSPNPLKPGQALHLHLPGAAQAAEQTFELLDLQGRLAQRWETGVASTPLRLASELPPGAYLLRDAQGLWAPKRVLVLPR